VSTVTTYKVTAMNGEVVYTTSKNEIINLLLAGLPLKSLEAGKKVVKDSWSCMVCGATTTDPEHSLITYFHMNCPGKKGK